MILVKLFMKSAFFPINMIQTKKRKIRYIQCNVDDKLSARHKKIYILKFEQ